jgi:hypothetical protein
MNCYQAALFKYPSASENVDVFLSVKVIVCLLVFMKAKSVTPSGLFALVPMSKCKSDRNKDQIVVGRLNSQDF